MVFLFLLFFLLPECSGYTLLHWYILLCASGGTAPSIRCCVVTEA